MLRTFISNPTLGGFGGESTTAPSSSTHPSTEAPTPDAFCQIIKELVDNAVDACAVVPDASNSSAKSSSGSTPRKKKRVRVVIERYQDSRKQRQKDSDIDDGDDDEEDDDDDDISVKSLDDSGEILRVMVSDNGCGMKDIQACVGAFHTSKAHNAATTAAATSTATTATTKGSSSNNKSKGSSKTKKSSNNKKSSSSSSSLASETAPTPPTEAQTAGRYGIGLTLCLLHAQRLVPNSCAFIQSAQATDAVWNVVTAVVDADRDVVQCLPRPSLAKSFPEESGTAISILVPGGPTAALAWPRLAEYFARFKLSLGMTCNLEVRAPTLSRVPLFVEPAVLGNSNKNVPDQPKAPPNKSNHKRVSNKQRKAQDSDCDDKDEDDDVFSSSSDKLRDIHQDDEAEQENSGNDGKGEEDSTENKAEPVSEERLAIWKATQQFLGRPVDLDNVAHFVAPIRAKTAPKLEVDVMVYGPHEDEDLDDCDLDCMSRNGDDEDDDDDSRLTSQPIKPREEESKSASMVLIRLVNKIPLLDSSEAVACGLVQGLSSKKRMWNSFGLNVGLKVDPSNVNKLPMFEVTDSEQVAPFFKSGAHNLLEQDDESEAESKEDVEDADNDSVDHAAANNLGAKRKRQKKRPRSLLPASVRIGNILVIAQIHAEPTTLPLPTLSKGRLPIDNKAIDDALEIGVTKCLLQLQKTNPSLLLTTSELRKAERDARYVPAVALALASILTKSVTSPDPTVLERIQKWDSTAPDIPSHVVTMTDDSSDSSQCTSSSGQNKTGLQGKEFNTENVESLGLLIEKRLRLVISQSETKGKPKKQSAAEKEADAEKENEMSLSSNLDDASVEGLNVDWDLLQQQFEATKGTTKNSNNNGETAGVGSNARAPRFDESSDDDDFEDLL